MITENDIRRALMRRTDLSAATKLTLMATLLRVDWQTWAGACTASDLSQLAGISKRSVRYSLQKAEHLGLITRQWGTVAGKVLPIISIKCEAILTPADIATPANTAPPAESAPPANTATLPLQDVPPMGGKTCPPRVADSAPLQLPITNQSNYQPHESSSEEITTDSFEEIAAGAADTSEQLGWLRLSDEMKTIIEQHCQFTTGFYERARVARKHLNIKLIRGGYYEAL